MKISFPCINITIPERIRHRIKPMNSKDFTHFIHLKRDAPASQINRRGKETIVVSTIPIRTSEIRHANWLKKGAFRKELNVCTLTSL